MPASVPQTGLYPVAVRRVRRRLLTVTAVHTTPRGLSPFGPRVAESRSFSEDSRFEMYPELNDDEDAKKLVGVGRRSRMCSTQQKFFSSDSFYHRLARAVSKSGAIDSKEFFESCEFVARTRRRVRRPCMVDLACGHGFTGILYAAMEESVQSVLLVDARKPQSFEILLAAVAEMAPWVRDKVQFVTGDLSSRANADALRGLSAIASASAEKGAGRGANGGPPPGAAVGFLAVHACGSLTDSCLDVAMAVGGPVAVMPCCYTGSAKGTPLAVVRAFGVAAAADISRTYRLEEGGYRVEWSTVPAEITPLNRIIVGIPPALPREGGGRRGETGVFSLENRAGEASAAEAGTIGGGTAEAAARRAAAVAEGLSAWGPQQAATRGRDGERRRTPSATGRRRSAAPAAEKESSSSWRQGKAVEESAAADGGGGSVGAGDRDGGVIVDAISELLRKLGGGGGGSEGTGGGAGGEQGRSAASAAAARRHAPMPSDEPPPPPPKAERSFSC